MFRPSQIFAFDGRITRRQFWLGHLVIFVSAVGAGIIGGLVLGLLSVYLESPALAYWGPAALAVIVTLCAMTAEFSLTVRRMRDRGGSPWWVGALAGMVLLADLLIGFNAVASGQNPFTPLTIMLGLFGLLLAGWIIFELGILGSAEGDNRFGALPRALFAAVSRKASRLVNRASAPAAADTGCEAAASLRTEVIDSRPERVA